jgi:hypothetical protein
MILHWPHWRRAPKAPLREYAPPLVVPWLELDRVRTALSCVILAGLLGLIIIGGRCATGVTQPAGQAKGLPVVFAADPLQTP